MKKRSFIIMVLITALLLPSVSVAAASPQEPVFNTYVFNQHGRAVPAPASFLPTRALNGVDLGVGPLRNPSDIVAGPDGYLYILDAGNGRIIILDENYETVQVLDEFTLNGEPFEFAAPASLFVVGDGRIHIADPELRRVITVNREGRVVMELGSPESEILPEHFHFTPISVVEDASGVLYILSRGSYQGALMVDLQRDNLFLGFFGANQVQLNVTQLGQVLWRRLFTREQRERMMQIIPVEFTNFDICPRGFIYVCTAFSENNVDQLRVLNSAGGNILRTPQVGMAVNYGDPVAFTSRYVMVTTSFVDITYIGDGMFAALDRTRGRVFVYTNDSHMVAQFGQLGEQFGRFTAPVAIASFNDEMIVLDSFRGEITIFGMTEYGANVRHALALHNEGRYEESIEYWRAVLAQNINFELAYLGIGRGLARSGQLQESLWYLRRADNRQIYSETMELYRSEFASAYFNWLAVGFILLCAGVVIINKRKWIATRLFGKVKAYAKN